jgi:C4-dicarboxylate-binding protein DctP
VADYKGKKYRIQSSKVLGRADPLLGGIPQVMAFSEVYQALQTGVVDGTENPPSNFYTQKMHEVQKHLSLTNHGYLGYAVIVNKKFWDGLPADVRGQLEHAMKQPPPMPTRLPRTRTTRPGRVKKSGKTTIYTPTKENAGAEEGHGARCTPRWQSRVGKETMQECTKPLALTPAKL